MLQERAWIYLFLGWTLVGGIILISLLPGSSIAVFNWQYLISLDKIGHFLSYGLAAWLFVTHRQLNKKHKNFAAIGFALFSLGISLELIQNKMENGRQFDVLDMLANGLGILFAWYISYRFKIKKDSAFNNQ